MSVLPTSRPTTLPAEVTPLFADPPDGLWAVVNHPDGPLTKLTGYNEGVTSVAFSRDGTLLAGGSRDWTVRLWRVR